MRPELIDRIIATREGGAVARCHTRQHIGEYTVGRHSYNAVSLLLLLWPLDHEGADPRMELVKALQWHDVQERWIGDVPALIKGRYEEFADALEQAEAAEQLRLGLSFQFHNDEWVWFKSLDLLEFYLWATEQRALGNTLYLRDERLCKERLQKPHVPMSIRDFVQSYEHHVLED